MIELTFLGKYHMPGEVMEAFRESMVEAGFEPISSKPNERRFENPQLGETYRFVAHGNTRDHSRFGLKKGQYTKKTQKDLEVPKGPDTTIILYTGDRFTPGEPLNFASFAPGRNMARIEALRDVARNLETRLDNTVAVVVRLDKEYKPERLRTANE